MDTPHQVQKLVDRYQKQLKRLDAHADKLSASEKKKYERLKERFIAQVKSWQQVSAREYAQVQSNLEEGYNELESVWYNVQRKH